ncbi:hypothetical protein PHJA_002954300, partial [Phtheirospermum japonicum]
PISSSFFLFSLPNFFLRYIWLKKIKKRKKKGKEGDTPVRRLAAVRGLAPRLQPFSAGCLWLLLLLSTLEPRWADYCVGTQASPIGNYEGYDSFNRAKPVGKFQPKAKFRPTKNVSFATSVSISQAVQTVDSTQSELIEPSKHCSDVVPDKNEGLHAFMEKSSVENSEVFIGLDIPGDTDPVVPSSDGCNQTHDTELVREEKDAFDLNNTAENDSLPTFQEDDVIDLSSMDFTHTLPTETTSECPSNEKPMNLEDVRKIPTKLATRRAKTASFPSPQQEETSPSSRKRKKASSDQDAVVKPKKFSRSTRRTRVVDRALLAIPDEELDYDTVPLRDLLARAEHIEKQMKKAAPVTKKSNGDSSGLNNEEDETFISKQGCETDGDRSCYDTAALSRSHPTTTKAEVQKGRT